jgi:O-antigen/teichoic acid export membrane protein
MLTQIDKVILSKLLTLADLGYYTLATTVSSSLLVVVSPVVQAIYPKFCELQARHEHQAFANNFHKSSQLISVIAGSFCITMIFFSQAFLEVWTQNYAIARIVSPLLIVLSFGILMNGLMWIPYQAQLAYKLTRIPILINVVSVIVLIPSIIYVVPKYGAIGAAWIWVALNLGYFFISGGLMFKHILVKEKWVWYKEDVFLPLVIATLVILSLKIVLPYPTTIVSKLSVVSISVIVALICSGFASKYIRGQFYRLIFTDR